MFHRAPGRGPFHSPWFILDVRPGEPMTIPNGKNRVKFIIHRFFNTPRFQYCTVPIA